jgi:RimJ/RimL family protein N-acetyltransferase
MSDVKTIPDASRPCLKDCDIIVLDLLSADEADKGVHPSHMKFQEVVAEIKSDFHGAAAPKAVWTVGMTHKIHHDNISSLFQEHGLSHVHPAWDGHSIEFVLDASAFTVAVGLTASAPVPTPALVDAAHTCVSQPMMVPYGLIGPRVAPPGPVLHYKIPRTALVGRHVTLRPYVESRDAAELFAVSNGTPSHGHGEYDSDAMIWKYMPRGPHATATDLAKAMKVLETAADTGAVFTLFDNVSETAIGSLSYLAHEPVHFRIEIGAVWCTPAFQGSPAMREAVYLMLRHAFEDLKSRRVEWKCHLHNVRSRKAAVKFGFKFEGVFRQHTIFKGTNRHTAWFAMTDGDWKGSEGRAGVKATFLSLLDESAQSYYAEKDHAGASIAVPAV